MESIRLFRYITLGLTIVVVLYLAFFQSPISYLWFCKVFVVLFLVALIIDSDQLYSSVLIGQSMMAVVFIVEVISVLVFKTTLIDINGIYTEIFDRGIGVFYHLFMPFAAFFILYGKRSYVKKAWLISTGVFFISSFIVYLGYHLNLILYTDYNINCAGYCQGLGAVADLGNYIYSILPVHPMIINTIVMGVVFYLFSLIYNRVMRH